ncbi:hypothetical protein SAMN05446935_9504 [Burkholderia sp. YR290]|jgi:hypothetical protein|nr:hypothetical protein SAMN05446934_7004 [Paraburkholderia hospita]SOE90222.1 hypothetical protein SAMN05446935_9504 [Burkholderia sp. YR290]
MQPFQRQVSPLAERQVVADHRLTKSVPIDPEKPFRFTNRGPFNK